jgi:hypothetical protein
LLLRLLDTKPPAVRLTAERTHRNGRSAPAGPAHITVNPEHIVGRECFAGPGPVQGA